MVSRALLFLLWLITTRKKKSEVYILVLPLAVLKQWARYMLVKNMNHARQH